MRTWYSPIQLLVLSFFLLAVSPCSAQQYRWPEERANAWYRNQPWPVGSNYIPDNAVNEVEMWQPATFDPEEIDKELSWAQETGMNTMRVFLHDLLWKEDAVGFKIRLSKFLDIAARHHIKPIFVLFDSCWNPYPHLGPQQPPIPGVHNSGWVQSPGKEALTHPAENARLKSYVQGVVGAFANDDRVLAWDVWNEPDNMNRGSYLKEEPTDKIALVDRLLPQVFAWAREMHPTQPLTSGLWQGDWSSYGTLSETSKIQVDNSDIISFHSYGWPEEFRERVKVLRQLNRPVMCTEYMARGVGSLFDTVLPIAEQAHVGALNWGFVAGKTQTYLPWDSWQRPYVLEEPPVWFHDIFHPDGSPYRPEEIKIIRNASILANQHLPANE
jgi:hypothetical protein